MLTATAELGLPVTLEVGLDILNGAFERPVDMVNKLSVYASATARTSKEAKRKNWV